MSIINRSKLAVDFPTHAHSAEFWEALGRAVATFGFLEEILGKAIFVFTGTKQIQEDRFEEEFGRWLPTLERALYDPLGNLIDAYAASARANNNATIKDLDDLLSELRAASVIRNALCHGSWRSPDIEGRSVPHYVDKRRGVFQTPIDITFLREVQRHVAVLACSVVDTVTHMGWQFPGSGGPGKPLF